MTPLHLHPVDYFNFHGDFKSIFQYEKEDVCRVISDTQIATIDPDNLSEGLTQVTYKLDSVNRCVSVLRANAHKIDKGIIVSPFYILSHVRFKGDYKAAESHVLYRIMKLEVPYVRVGTSYFKVIPKKNRWGGEEQNLVTWKKEAMTDDHGKGVFKLVPKYDDFVIVPDNKNYAHVHGDCYNLYSPFPHKPFKYAVKPEDIPQSLTVIRHIFGDQFELGLKYMKVLYERPNQMLPIITLVSKEKGTGKTTFLNWMYILFGQNVTTVNPENLNSEFNSSYAKKNILLFEEMFAEKSAAYQKVMALTTGKMITYRDLHASGVSIPFFGKLIFCTNKVRDFMRIDSEENRFWIRYIKPVATKKNIGIENNLLEEAEKFIKYLDQLPPIDYDRDRLVFTLEDIRTEHLDDVKEESKSGLCKEIEIQLQHFFDNCQDDEFRATAKDLKEKWFAGDHKTSIAYIRKVLTQEMELAPEKLQRYVPFNKLEFGGFGTEIVGLPFKFQRKFASLPPVIKPEKLQQTDLLDGLD